MTKSQLKQLIREAYSELTVDKPDFSSDWAAVLVDEVKKIFGDKYQGYNFLDKSNRSIKIYTSITQPISIIRTTDKSILPDRVFTVKDGDGKVSTQRGWSSLFSYLKSINNQSKVAEGADRGHPDEPLLKWLNKRLAGGRESDYDIRGDLVKLRDKLSKDVEAHKSRMNVKENVETDINQVASGLKFQPVTKKKIVYKYVENGVPGSMPPMTYTKSTTKQTVVTTTSDGKETQNVAEPEDIIMSGPSKENYVIKASKFPKLYVGNVGGNVHPEQSPRQVALYGGEQFKFKAPWGEDMVIKPGDYLVKDPSGNGYYRIAKAEFEQTYNSLK